MSTNFHFKNFIIVFICLHLCLSVTAIGFPAVTINSKATILYDGKGPALDSISAHLLAEDIERVTNYLPRVINDISQAKGDIIVVGNIRSQLIQKFISNQSFAYKRLTGKWECFYLNVIDKPLKNISSALIIAGSDDRGTAYGVFTISQKIGVSPWYWWADVPVIQKRELMIDQNEFLSAPPSVKYRGIFINDEDWGLRPWSATSFEPEKKKYRAENLC